MPARYAINDSCCLFVFGGNFLLEGPYFSLSDRCFEQIGVYVLTFP